MKFNIIIISTGLALGAFCSVLDNKVAELAELAELISVPSFSYNSLATTGRVKNVESSDLLSAVNSVRPAVSELTKRAEPWTAEEEKLLLKLRGQRMSWAEINKFFPERSWAALATKYYHLVQDPSIKKIPRTVKLWTYEENELLLELVETNISWREIAKYFPSRSLKAIKGHLYFLKSDSSAPQSITSQFTAEEDELLIQLGKAGIPWKERAKFFENRTISGLKTRYSRIDPASKTPSYRKYTSEEDDLIREGLKLGKTVKEISNLLEERGVSSVQRRIKKLRTAKPD